VTPRWLPLIALAVSLAGFASVGAADQVTPSQRVKSRLNVRAEAAPGSRVVAGLRPGDVAPLVATRDGWHEVQLEDGSTGFVSAAFSEVLPEPEPEPEPVAEIPYQPVTARDVTPRRGAFASVGDFFRRLFSGGTPIELVIAEPAHDSTVYRHTDPNLPVSGYARADGAGRVFDVMLVLDTSTSTNEYAETDVDLDGEPEDEWMGNDSIYRAQLVAAASFVRTIAELPYNQQGQRIRVGIVTCAGEDRYRLAPQDKDLEITLETIRWLAHRDARVELPLTPDYAAAESRLRELWKRTPVGMTNVAAGIGRAVIELTGDKLRWAQSEPRPEAEKVILFLSDGKPRLPYEREKAERAASYAGKLASEYGIRINAFELGYNVVSRSKSFWLHRMATRTGGRHVSLERPGEIVGALQTTPLSMVDRVKVRNRTTGDETPRIATAIDGSFYAEIPLEEGRNLIDVEALLDDGGAKEESFEVAYVPGTPTDELERQLDNLRSENAALLERIREDLVGEMERARREQRRQLELTIRDGDR
jgi:hypothetical protein